MTPERAAIVTNTENDGTPSIVGFFLENGRLPFVDDPVKPWAYRGWLLPYRMMLERHPDITPRYDYVIRTIENGKLLDEPIPQVRFAGENDSRTKEGFKMLRDMIAINERATGYHRAFEAVAEWLAFALGITDKPSALADRDQEQLYRTCDLSKWLLAPTDYLGNQMAEDHIGRAAGFYPTPMAVCTLMAQMTHPEGIDHRLKTAHDPAVGTGRTLLAASNYCLRLFGQDVSYLAVLVCKVNLALYAPWHHIPRSFFPDDPEPALAPQPMAEEKRLEGAGIARNTATATAAAEPTKTFTTEIEQLTLFGCDQNTRSKKT